MVVGVHKSQLHYEMCSIVKAMISCFFFHDIVHMTFNSVDYPRCDFVLGTRIVQFLFYLNPKFQASSSVLRLYRPVCVGPVQKPHCWFSHEAALIFLSKITDYEL